MEVYKKPIIADKNFLSGLIPALLGPVFGAAKVGLPIIALAASALASKKGNTIIDSMRTTALTARKDFAIS